MKEKKNILIIVLLVIFILLSIFVLINKNNNIIYIGNYTKIKIKNGDIKIINKNSNINLTKAKILFNDEFVNGYLKSNKSDINNKVNIYNAYNEDGKILRFTDDLLAYVGKVDIKVASPNLLTLPLESDYSFMEDFINKKADKKVESDYPVDYENYKKIIYDIDNDGDLETIYSVELLEGIENDYSYVFLIDDNKSFMISECSGKLENVDLKKVSFFKLIDFDNDNKYEIVLRVKQGDYGKNYYKVFKYDSKLKEIK